MNEMIYWSEGGIWGGSKTTVANNPGATTYWIEGNPYGDVFPTPSSNTSSFMMWFTF